MEKIRAYKGQGKYVFVSYSHQDNDLVLPIIGKLQEKYNVWFDEGIYFGDDYKKTIIAKINNCALFIYMVSENSLLSSYCKKEIKQAERKNKPFFNVVVDKKALESDAAEEFLFDYEEFQMCLYFNMALNDFVSELERKAPGIRETEIEKRQINIEEELKREKKSFDDLSLGNVDKADRDNKAAAEERRSKINDLFLDYNVGARIDDYKIGRSFTTYLLRIGLRTPIREISKIEKEIALSLGGIPIRFSEIDPIYKKPTLEIVNPIIKEFSFKECLLQLPDVSSHPLAVPFGLDSQDKLLWDDMNACPHILIAGTTGSGKSIFIHALLSSLVYRLPPSLLRLVILNPNKTEFSLYKDLPHLLTPITNDVSSFGTILNSLYRIMEERYVSFMENDVTQITHYNELMRESGKEPLPYILLVIDEYQLYASENKEIATTILRLAQKSRAAGIHILLSSQRCSPDILTGSLIANMPTKVAFQTSSPMDSHVVLGVAGAESLLGKGDMLLSSFAIPGSLPVRLQGAFISNNDMKVIFEEIKSTYPLQYDETLLFQSKNVEEVEVPQSSGYEEESLYPSVEAWAKEQEYVSISKIQRTFGVGFNRSGKLFALLQKNNVIEPSSDHSKGYRVIKN